MKKDASPGGAGVGRGRLLLESLDRGDLENLDRAHLFAIQDRLLELREEVERVRNPPLTGV